MERTIEHLLQQAYLFDDPRAYQAGVRDAVSALTELRDRVDDARNQDPAVLETIERRERRSA